MLSSTEVGGAPVAGENVWTDPRLGIGQGGVEVRRGRERLFPVRLHGGFFQNRKRCKKAAGKQNELRLVSGKKNSCVNHRIKDDIGKNYFGIGSLYRYLCQPPMSE